jgi:hypothetical protein
MRSSEPQVNFKDAARLIGRRGKIVSVERQKHYIVYSSADE